MRTVATDEPVRSRGLELLLNLGLALLSVLLGAGLVEIGLRIAGYRAIYEMYSKPSIFWQHDELLGWSHQPGAVGEYVGPRPWPVEFRTEVRINSLGLRGPELAPLQDGARRVLLLGDSMVAGFEVPYESTFGARLGPKLAERIGAPVEMINGGVRGYGTDQVYLFYRERGRRFAPDVVVAFYSGNDPSDNTTLHEMRRPLGKPAFALRPDGSLALVGHPVPNYPSCSEYRLTKSYEVMRIDGTSGRMLCFAQMALFDHSALFSFVTLLVPWDPRLLGRLYYVGNPHLEYLRDEGERGRIPRYAQELTMALLLALEAEVRSDGASLLLIGDPRDLRQLDDARLRAAGIEPFSLAPIEGKTPQEIRFQHDSHYNVIGHARVAELLAPAIEERLERRRSEGSFP